MYEYIVETNNLTKKYGKHAVVNGIDLKVPKGAIYGFIGRNGAGKSTTLKMICDLVIPTSGELVLFGNNEKELKYRRIGALIENVGAYADLSAKENMILKATGMGIHGDKEVNDLLALMGLSNLGKKAVKKFSMGMKQRLGIAMAMLGKPDLLILDEPTNGLDPEGIRDIRNIILELNENKGITFIVSSHILGELDKVSTHYGIIKDGVLMEQLSHKELLDKCKSYVSLKVNEESKATHVLEQDLKITDYEVLEDEIRVYNIEDTNEISAALFKANVQINQIIQQKQDLESYFLDKQGLGGERHV